MDPFLKRYLSTNGVKAPLTEAKRNTLNSKPLVKAKKRDYDCLVSFLSYGADTEGYSKNVQL